MYLKYFISDFLFSQVKEKSAYIIFGKIFCISFFVLEDRMFVITVKWQRTVLVKIGIDRQNVRYNSKVAKNCIGKNWY